MPGKGLMHQSISPPPPPSRATAGNLCILSVLGVCHPKPKKNANARGVSPGGQGAWGDAWAQLELTDT